MSSPPPKKARKKPDRPSQGEGKRRPPFEFDGTFVVAGTARDLELRVARLPAGVWMSLPVSVVHGLEPGPTLWLSAALHGDELNGVATIRQLLSRIDPAVLHGTVLAVPMVNVFGVTIGSRYLPDRRDLNRSFPGSARGSMAARLANLFFQRVVSRADFGLDFHTGSGGRYNLPHIRCDMDEPQTRRCAEAFGAPLVLHAEHRSGSLREEANKRGIRSLLYEAGEAERLSRRAVKLGVDGALRVMGALEMLAQVPDKNENSRLSRSSSWVRSPRSGLCMLDADVGAEVAAGQRIGTVLDATTSLEVPVVTRVAGLVIGALRTAIVHRGDALVHVAELPA